MVASQDDAMGLPIQARVYAGEGACGESLCIVLNPSNDRVTDVVFKLHGSSEQEVLVPLHHVREVSKVGFRLDLRCDEVRSLPEIPIHRNPHWTRKEDQHE